MDIENMKNMVILKNLPSNIIEEAFVVLKDNIQVHKQEFVGKKMESKNNTFDGEYVIKEAEMLVREYENSINKNEYRNVKEKIQIEKKIKNLKMLNFILLIFSGLITAGLLSNIF